MDIDWDLLCEIHKDMPRQGSGRNKYTKKAFDMIPRIDKPNILDIGCGPGMQTIALAKLSGGHVIGIDIIQQYLDQLQESIEKEHLQDRVEAVNQSMDNIQFPEASFDILWAEGSIFIMGFEQGLREWKKFLKPKGCLAVHEMAWIKENPPQEIREYWERVYPQIATIETNLRIIEQCGYRSIGTFPLPEDAWWELYYTPLENRLKDLRIKFKDNSKAMEMIEESQLEINMFRKYNAWYGSVFYVMQKQ
ncbi:MAG: class I SAM-dependent methyltransferase [Candidatus Thermoplasmatota archaeon]|nr:class I SAM-dependent methyltransferase [Candidatus Thermoplasmatota archaeon]